MAESSRAELDQSNIERLQADDEDADSDYEELQADIAKVDESVRSFLATRHAERPSSTANRGGSRSRGPRGPRKAAKPRGDITARLSKVNQAFLTGDYELALDLAFEVIRINAETHQAWTALSSTFAELGDTDKALSAMVYAAHLRPKDVPSWLSCASYAVDNISDENPLGNLNTARLCYSAALRADPTNLEARLGKANVSHRQGHLMVAINEYTTILKKNPGEIELVRKLAEACVDVRSPETAVPPAIAAYRRFFDMEIQSAAPQSMMTLGYDVAIYVELFASAGRYNEAIFELKSLCRWLVGRAAESYWDDWQGDDREWDEDDIRRSAVQEFNTSAFDALRYGSALPMEFRARLAIYRFRLRDELEAMNHLSWMDPTAAGMDVFCEDYPFVVFELAEELLRHDRPSLAAQYFELFRLIPGNPDPSALLQLGRCYVACGDLPAAEECFLAAIDADEDSIEPRIELANMYENAREGEEALILTAEALALRDARDRGTADDSDGEPEGEPSQPEGRPTGRKRTQAQKRRRLAADGLGRSMPVVPKRYRAKRFAGPDKRLQDERARAVGLTTLYEKVRDLKSQIKDGRLDLVPTWMEASRELVNDFRSLKKFYAWDTYLHFLGSRAGREADNTDRPRNDLTDMYQRLSQSLAPAQPGSEKQRLILESHEGIAFDKWLDLFLDYAIGLAMAHRRDEAYQVCQAATDSTVFQSPENLFVIHVAWSVCAIYTSDEERAISTARSLIKDGLITDSYRMFALVSMLCQSPASWYTSGPAQKFLLRQIKAIDDSHDAEARQEGVVATTGTPIDVCLLMLYGHVLFTSTSFTYALGYFLRARSIDPDNLMINLSLGLAYVHYGLKRQATNRQYLLLQGQSFLSRYAELARGDPNNHGGIAEAYYNLGRLFHLLGISSLAGEYYTLAMRTCKEGGGNVDLELIISLNRVMAALVVGNTEVAFATLKTGLVL